MSFDLPQAAGVAVSGRFGGIAGRGRLCWLGVATLFICISSGLGPGASVAAAQVPNTLWTRCAQDYALDISCRLPRGIAADSASGHVFVSDQSNRRIVEFTALGAFIKTWGWDVVEGGGVEFEVCVPADGDSCKGGTSGAGVGQFGVLLGPQGLAIDSVGSVYVVDQANHRVQKFDPEGSFLRMWGKEVNSGTSGDSEICTNAGPPSDVCGAGGEGTGAGQFTWPSAEAGSFIAIDTEDTESDADDRIYVGDKDRIQVFDAQGEYQESLALPGETVRSLAVGPEGNLYAVYFGKRPVNKLSPSGETLGPSFTIPEPDPFTAPSASAVAVDSEGHVYAFNATGTGNGFIPLDRIYEFGPGGNVIASWGKSEFSGSTGMATNLCPGDESPGNLYIANAATGSGFPPEDDDAFVRAYGPGPKNCGKAITGQASEITETTATLNGKANPRGEPVTECRFQYGLTQAYGSEVPCAQGEAEIGEGTDPVDVNAEIAGLTKGTVYHVRLIISGAGGTEAGADATYKTLGPPVVLGEAASNVTFTEARLKGLVNPEGFSTTYRFEYGTDIPYGQSTAPIPVGSDRSEHAALADLADLEPGTAYHWRIVASNKSGATTGPDHVFTTYAQPVTESCPNETRRTGPTASLPDCRAYEMVSPVDKNGGNIFHLNGYVQSTDNGEVVTYDTPPAFGEVQASVVHNQYLAKRDPVHGWLNRGIHPPVTPASLPVTKFFGLFREFMAFSPDLCSAWFLDLMKPPLTAAGQSGYNNHYRLDLCGDAEPEALTDVEPLGEAPPNYVNLLSQSVAGASNDSQHALFSAAARLTDEAAETVNAQIYDRFEGNLHVVSIRPNGVADATETAVGSGPGFNLQNAVSADGSRVYWSSGVNSATGRADRIFVREHPEQGMAAGECDNERTVACTVLVSGGGVLGAYFWAAAGDGSAVLFSLGTEDGERLFVQEFDESDGLSLPEAKLARPRREVAEHVLGVVGVSDDLSHIYFVSTDVLAEGGEVGEPNLYLDQGGTLTYIATLAPGEVARGSQEEEIAYDLASSFPRLRAARVSPDGANIVFQSRAQLSEFDNTDSETGKPLVEVYTYEAGGELYCVSCDPSGGAPNGSELSQPFLGEASLQTGVFASAWIQTWENPLYASRMISDDGSRIFFNSYESLLPRDTNGALDVYEWERAGTGSCSESSPSYFAKNGGCLFLISSGKSATDSEFWDASADGSDVFFSTESSLVPHDTELVDLYDARVDGGFPPPPAPPAECEGEACQNPPPPPQFSTPSSDSYVGPPNPRPGRCLRQARRAAKLSRRAKRARRAAKRARRAANHAGAKRLQGKAARNARRARKASRNAKRCRRAARKGANR